MILTNAKHQHKESCRMSTKSVHACCLYIFMNGAQIITPPLRIKYSERH